MLRYRLFFVLLMMLVIYHNKLHHEDVFNNFFLVLFHFHHNKSKAECQLLNRMGWGLPIPCFQKPCFTVGKYSSHDFTIRDLKDYPSPPFFLHLDTFEKKTPFLLSQPEGYHLPIQPINFQRKLHSWPGIHGTDPKEWENLRYHPLNPMVSFPQETA